MYNERHLTRNMHKKQTRACMINNIHKSTPARKYVTHVSFIADACQTSPQHMPEVITVAATNSNDMLLSRNYGSCVDMYAPGLSILSAMDTSDTASLTY